MANTMEITPSKMAEIATKLGNDTDTYRNKVKEIYTLEEQMDAMWDGEANEAFKMKFLSARQSFDELGNMMAEYANAVLKAAQTYVQGEENVRQIVSKG